MEGQQRSMLHADGPQGGAINLQKNHTEYTTANLNSVELFGLTMQKTRIKITEDYSRQNDINGTGFHHIHLI